MENDSHSEQMASIGKYYNEFGRRMNEAYYSYVKYLVSLSSGTLALTVSFRNSLSGSAPARQWLLQAGWLCFAGAILAGLIVLYGETELYRQAGNDAGKALRDDRPRPLFAKLGKIYCVSFGVCCLLFAAGTVLLALYAVVNP